MALAAQRTTEYEPPSDGSSRGLVAALAVLVIGVLGSSWLIGTVAAPANESFDWEVASVFGTAVGTVLLAAATFFLASSTREDVRASRASIDLARNEQQEARRPIVIVSDGPHLRVEPASVRVELRLANVGRGPAVEVHVRGSYYGNVAHVDIEPQIVPVILPDTERACVLTVASRAGDRERVGEGTVSVEGDFGDLFGLPAGRVRDVRTAR